MKVRFNFNKDNHFQGQEIDLSPSDFKFWYWQRKGAISPIQQDNQKPKQQRKKRSKQQ